MLNCTCPPTVPAVSVARLRRGCTLPTRLLKISLPLVSTARADCVALALSTLPLKVMSPPAAAPLEKLLISVVSSVSCTELKYVCVPVPLAVLLLSVFTANPPEPNTVVPPFTARLPTVTLPSAFVAPTAPSKVVAPFVTTARVCAPALAPSITS